MSPQESHDVVNMFEWEKKTHEFIEEVDISCLSITFMLINTGVWSHQGQWNV